MNFKEYFEIKESQFDELPRRQPYGFWIKPDGSFEIVPSSHASTGMHMVDNDPVLGPEYEEKVQQGYIHLYRFLLDKGYIRASIITDYHTHDKTLYYQFRTAVNHHQARTIKDLAKFYNADTKGDKSTTI